MRYGPVGDSPAEPARGGDPALSPPQVQLGVSAGALGGFFPQRSCGAPGFSPPLAHILYPLVCAADPLACAFPQTVTAEIRTRIAAEMATVAASARSMRPRDAVTDLYETLRTWENSLRKLCPGDASSVREIRCNVQTAAGSHFDMSSFGQTVADDILTVRGRLLGEQAQWKEFVERAEKNLAKGRVADRYRRSSSPERGSAFRKSSPPRAAPRPKTNHDKPSGKRLYTYLQKTVGKTTARGDCYVCAFLSKPQRGQHDYKHCRFFDEALEKARAQSDYKDRG